MGISSKVLRRRNSGFTLIEVLTVLVVSSVMLVLLALVFKSGLSTVGRSSGRIEIVRNGRHALDQVQRYLGSACQPGFRLDPSNAQAQAIFGPAALDDLDSPNPADHVRFWSAIDHLGNTPKPTARQLQEAPVFFAYDLTTIPGVNGVGQDLVLRRFQVPAEPALPTLFDTTVQPRVLARRIGLPISGSYEDGFLVRHIREGALQLTVNVSSELISDDLANTQVKNAQNLRIKMSTIYQLPFYSVQ